MKLKGKILLLSILPIVLLGCLMIFFSGREAKFIAQDQLAKTLEATAVSALSAYTLGLPGEYHVDENGQLWKGDMVNISTDTEVVDAIHNETGLECTFIYDGNRVMTSLLDDKGDRIYGTPIDSEVWNTIKSGETYYASIDINGKPYDTYCIPVYQEGSDSEVIGSVFVGQETTVLKTSIRNMIFNMIVLTLIIMVVFIIIVVIITKAIEKALLHGVDVVQQVASGDLTVEIEEKHLARGDEVGKLTTEIARFKDDLKEIINHVVEDGNILIESSIDLNRTATETVTTIEQVDKAVQDIANGATSQAEETQIAADSVRDMEEVIESTLGVVEKLSKNALDMKYSSEEALKIIDLLENTNVKTKDAIDMIYEQTNTTNESALKIKEATELITSIAEETNLLSLNASIEAARAGEQGRGFAVVASQIQKLAEQSNESANRIASIIDELIRDSSNAVSTMNSVKEIMNNQTKNVDKTEEIFSYVKVGIDTSIDGIDMVASHTEKIEMAKSKVIDVVQNLTAIAEENAASAEETSAAVTEVSASVAEVTATSEQLEEVANALSESISIFKL